MCRVIYVYMTRLNRIVAREGRDNVPLHLFSVLKIFHSSRTTWVNPRHSSRYSFFAFSLLGWWRGKTWVIIENRLRRRTNRLTRVDDEIESWTFPLHIVRFSRGFPWTNIDDERYASRDEKMPYLDFFLQLFFVSTNYIHGNMWTIDGSITW